MDSLISFFGKVLTPTIIVSVISTIVGAFIAYIGYKLNRQRKEFDTSNHIRNVLTDLFEFDRKIGDELALIKSDLAEKFPLSSFEDVHDTSALLVKLHEITSGQREKELDQTSRTCISRAANLHYYNQNHRALLIHSIEDLLRRYGNLLNNYEKYVAYHSMMVSPGMGKEKSVYWYNKAKEFYKSMKSSKDYSNMIRIGISLAGTEIDNGLLDAAAAHLEEISDKDLRKGANLDTEFIHQKIELQKRRLNYYMLFGPNDEPS